LNVVVVVYVSVNVVYFVAVDVVSLDVYVLVVVYFVVV
jgi:hypothetical protein